VSVLNAHIPVLAREAFDALAVQADGLYIDATFGRGGHTALILGALGPEGRVLAFDRDPAAIEAGHRRFPDEVRLALVGAPFADIAARVPKLAQGRAVRGILFDLGVSSPQLDDPARGFSFRADGPLDMRMDPAGGEPVSAWLARAGEPEIREVIATLGEERFARRIAAQIVAAREKSPLTRTLQLADLVARAVRTREPGKHPATRTFQALRIHVNRELDDLALARARNAAALSPDVGSMRMSSGPSDWKLKPRRASSSCGDETPRSSSTPSRPATAASHSPSDAKLPWRIDTRGSPPNAARACAMASGSLSTSSSRPRGDSRARISRAWPPRPNVPSR
jgi:16S rRNA (cytosine1402-N4)-methyltransferase